MSKYSNHYFEQREKASALTQNSRLERTVILFGIAALAFLVISGTHASPLSSHPVITTTTHTTH